MYASNTVIYFSTTDSQVIAHTLTNELALLNKWLIDNNLFMHKGKKECMLFGTGPRLALFTSFSVALTEKHLIALLGITILGLLSMRNVHVEYFTGKVRKRLAMLGRIKKNIT